MKLITDDELIAYVEGILTATERKEVLLKLRENDQMDLLFHLQQSYMQIMKVYADELLGVDEYKNDNSYDLGDNVAIAAKNKEKK